MRFSRWTLALFALAQVSYAQVATGVLEGKVFTLQHNPASATTIIALQAGKQIAKTITDSRGSYSFSLPAGNYVIDVDNVSKQVFIAGRKSTILDIVIPDSDQLAFSDSPQFTVAGVTDNTYRGGHGSDTMLRSTETLAKATASLGKPSTEDSAEPMHGQAEQDEKSGHALEAVKEFQKAAEINPSERNIFDWATELLNHRASDGAALVFTKGNHLFPNSTRMLLGLATALYSSGSFEQARQYFFEAVDLNPNDPTPYAFLNKAQAREIKQSPGYFERISRFADLHPENALANYYLGLSLWDRRSTNDNKESVERACSLLKKAVDLDPHLASAHLALGVVYSFQRKFQDAINSFQLALRERPDLEEAHYRLAEIYRVSGSPLKAQEELAAYKQLSARKAGELERERRDLQQFVIALKQKSQ